MDERRTVKLGETYRSFAEAERRVIPIVSKCLEGMVSAAKAVDSRKVCSRAEDVGKEEKNGKPEHIFTWYFLPFRFTPLTYLFPLLFPGFNNCGGVV